MYDYEMTWPATEKRILSVKKILKQECNDHIAKKGDQNYNLT